MIPILLLGVGGPCLIVRAIRHRLTIAGDDVESVGVFGTRRINLTQVGKARWRIGTDGGKLVLQGSGGKLAVEFSAYPSAQARQLIKFFRLRLPEAVQSGWEKYWNFSWHFFDLPDPVRREEFAAETRAMRLRLAVFVLLGVVVAVGVGSVAWRFTGNVNDMLRSLMAVFILPIVFLVRADRGKISGTIDVRPKVPKLMTVALAIFSLALFAFLLLAIFDVPGRNAVFLAGGIAAMVLMLITSSIARIRN